MKRTDPLSIRQIIDRVIDRSTTKNDVQQHRAAYLWPDIVGQGINRHTTRRYVNQGVLHVYIDSAPMKTELEFQKSAIIKAINDAMGDEILTSLVIH
jgi:predicted nucleic acid-binding Zn ribbon protein